MYKILDPVKSTVFINERVPKGTNGTIVIINKENSNFEVEFFDDFGETTDIITVNASDIEKRKTKDR